jgi:hypothetical protein
MGLFSKDPKVRTNYSLIQYPTKQLLYWKEFEKGHFSGHPLEGRHKQK